MRQENGEEEVNCFSSYLEVRYTITDTSKINKELMEALKARFRVLPVSARPVWWTDDKSWLDYVDADERAMEIIAKADPT